MADRRGTPRGIWTGLLIGGAILAVSPASAQISPGPLSRAHSELEGALSCLKCHGAGRASLDQHCSECHKAIAWLIDEGRGLHGRQEKKECAPCHPEHAGIDFELIDWEDGSPEQFDHSRAGWSLDGKHAVRKCRDCHKPEFQKGHAASLLEESARKDSWLGLDLDCRTCHDDVHRGALSPECRSCHGMGYWKPAPWFDHQKTAFPLLGKHAPVECAKCHLDPDLPLTSDATGQPVPVYKPVPHQECSSCHDDPHKGQLGLGCATCHSPVNWNQVDQKAFDHARTRFPLRGRHAPLKCDVCHDPQKAWGKKPPMDTCDACHKDPHAGKATLAGKAVDCASCHNDRGFRPATYTVANHESAPYPLQGKHREVKCEACHIKDPPDVAAADLGKAGILLRRAHERCLDCHIDSHAGQLDHREDGGTCESCHVVDNWKPSQYTVADHAGLSLSLEGRHGEVDCSACHGPERPGLPAFPASLELGKARVALSLLPSGCETCHLDPHQGLFEAGGERAKEEGCLACHDARSFVPSIVDVRSHGTYSFPLKESHRAVPCIDCHQELTVPPSGAKLIVFEGTPRKLSFQVGHERCSECHETPHGEQFARRKDGGACEGCHDESSFQPAPLFDHALADFRLEGAHQRVSCDKCHPTGSDPEGKPQTIFRPLPHKCQDCHRGRTFAPGELSGNTDQGGPS